MCDIRFILKLQTQLPPSGRLLRAGEGVLCPAGGAGGDGVSREAEGQQGAEPTAEKLNSVRPNSLDIFSPARDGQTMPSLTSRRISVQT